MPWDRGRVDKCGSDGHSKATGGTRDPAKGSGVEAPVERLRMADLCLGGLPGASTDGRGGVQCCLNKRPSPAKSVIVEQALNKIRSQALTVIQMKQFWLSIRES